MSRRNSPLVPIAFALALVGGLIFVLRRPSGWLMRGPSEPLSACPAGAFLVARADVAALRKTALGDSVDPMVRALVPFPRAASAGECAIDPASRVESVALVVPEGEDRHDLGLAVKLRLEREELERCGKALSESSASKKPETRGSFSLFASGDARADTLAITQSGLAILAGREWANAMVDAADGKRPAATTAPPHSDLLAAATPKTSPDGGQTTRAIVMSVALPAATRQRVRREIEAELAPGSDDRVAMEGVLGVEAVAAAIDVATDTEIALELRCDAAPSCAKVHQLLERKRKSWGQNPVLRLLGVGGAVDSLTVSAQGARLSAKTRLPTLELRAALERGLAWRGFASSASALGGSSRPSKTPEPAITDASPSADADAGRPTAPGGPANEGGAR